MRTSSMMVALTVTLAPSAAWAQTDGYALDDSHVNYWEARGFCLAKG